MRATADRVRLSCAGVAALRQMAERGCHTYWMGWAANASVAVATVFGSRVRDEDQEVRFDRLDPKQADHLATLDGRFISDLAIRRAQSGDCGWTGIEIARIQAVSLSWFDPVGAMQALDRAKDLARTSGVAVWNDRLRRSEDEIVARAAPQRRNHRAAG